jgi:transposase-like protein
MTKRRDRDAIYVKSQFDTEIIVLWMRWYITYRLSYRDLVEMMAERYATDRRPRDMPIRKSMPDFCRS